MKEEETSEELAKVLLDDHSLHMYRMLYECLATNPKGKVKIHAKRHADRIGKNSREVKRIIDSL